MDETDTRGPYQPVSCAFYSRLELFALGKKLVQIVYRDGDAVKVLENRIKTIRTIAKAEYLVTMEDKMIRLDDLISVQSAMG